MHAFVISKLDTNNSLLAGYPDCLTKKLQSVQNAAAKLIYRRNRSDRAEPPLKDLHWLPVNYRIEFKVLLLVYKCLKTKRKEPEYLKELLKEYTTSHSQILRSTNADFLVEPRTRLTTFGDRAFSVIAPKLWNSLPSETKNASSVHSFKKSLKTYFFRLAYD